MKDNFFLYTFPKRLIDIVFATMFIFIFSPIYLVSMIIIFMQDFHNPFYTQVRIGKNKTPFNFYKFRSMVVNADDILFKDKKLYNEMRSGSNKVKNDPRVTKFGRFIRKYSIDEFPQMLNVLKGDMSVVGPRALRVDEYELYASKSPVNKEKLKEIGTVNPGITGYWQVGGRSSIDFDTRIDMDCLYAKKKSIVFDIEILVKTPYAVIKGEGAF
jgi:exopolysaccharide production protein ExoY